jgi:hypothetical protein
MTPTIRPRLPPRSRPRQIEHWRQTNGWIPNAWQERACRATTPHVGIVAGRRAGKTRFAAEVAAAVAVFDTPGAQWALGPDYEKADLVFSECWRTLRAAGFALPSSSYHRGVLNVVNGSVITRRSGDATTGLVGWHNRRVTVDEVARVKHRVLMQDVMPTLSDDPGDWLWITSPAGHDFVFDAWGRWKRGDAPDWTWYEAPSWENEYVFPGGRNDPKILSQEREYDAAGLHDLFRQEFGAEFVAFAGRVFKRWDRRSMVVPTAECLRGVVTWYIGYDWGWEHNTAIILAGLTSGGDWRICDEAVSKGATPAEIDADLLGVCRRNGLSPDGIEWLFPDPSRPEQAAAFRQLGFRVTAAHNDRADGILAVAAALARPGGFLVADRVKVLPVELDNLHHSEDRRDGNMEYVRRNDDSYDATRYILASVAKRARSAVSTFRADF